jgi:hypothetical protein
MIESCRVHAASAAMRDRPDRTANTTDSYSDQPIRAIAVRPEPPENRGSCLRDAEGAGSNPAFPTRKTAGQALTARGGKGADSKPSRVRRAGGIARPRSLHLSDRIRGGSSRHDLSEMMIQRFVTGGSPTNPRPTDMSTAARDGRNPLPPLDVARKGRHKTLPAKFTSAAWSAPRPLRRPERRGDLFPAQPMPVRSSRSGRSARTCLRDRHSPLRTASGRPPLPAEPTGPMLRMAASQAV